MSTSTAVHSNAFNFLSYVQHGVDPRTGQYTMALSVPELRSHALAGPALPLSIAFSPMNTRDAGFGLGWGINLTEFDPGTRILSLGTGETFKITGSGAQPAIAEKKLDSFHFHDDGNDRYRVVHRSGLVEILKLTGGSAPLALPEQVLGPEGRAVSLTYVPFGGGQRLETVSDPRGELLRVLRNEVSDQVELLFFPGQGPGGDAMARFVLQLDGQGRVTRLTLPTEEQACWQLAYDAAQTLACLSEVWTPSGAHETIRYTDEGHLFPGAAHAPLPRVTSHVIDPGSGQAASDVQYTYTNTNFLGYGVLSDWLDDGLDNLYKVNDADFQYGSFAALRMDGEVVRRVDRFYNRFHLLTREITTQGDCRRRVVTSYYADLPENRNKPFTQQPPQCQLPMSVQTVWELSNDATRQRTETSQTRFDIYGNLIEQINTDGTREVLEYYPAAGSGALCPADPEGFVRSLRTRTTHPATSAHGSAPTLRAEHAYVALSPLPGDHSKPFLAEQWQTLAEVGGGVLKRVETEYFDDPADTLRLGREKAVTEIMDGKPTVTDHQYTLLASARAGEQVLQVIETITGFDGAHRTVTQEHSLLNGEALLVQGDDGVEIRYEYDALARVTREIVAPDTDYVASRTYAYHLVAEPDGERAWQRMTDVKGVQTRTWLDGQSRAVLEERQDADAAIAAGEPTATASFRATWQATYNSLGELVEEAEIDWLGSNARTLRRVFAYDNWGERTATTRPDGVVEHDVLDPISTPALPGVVRRQWLEDTAGNAGGVVETGFDAFGEPVRIERFDTKGASISLQLNHHDGLGRLAEHVNAREARTLHTYDAFDRSLQTTLPGNAVVARGYATHSSEDLPTTISVDGVVLGTQTFDGLDRLVAATTGGRTRTLHYDDGKDRPARVVTPARQEIHYEYLPQLGEEITVRRLPEAEANYRYDPENSRLLSCAEQGVGLEREYYSTGEIKKETRQRDGGGDEVAEYTYSLRGRLMTCRMLGANQAHGYDASGRLLAAGIDSTISKFTYDSFGRVGEVHSTDTSQGIRLTMTLGYDDFGRETSRRFETDTGTREMVLTYDSEDALATRVLTEGATVVRDESFFYDVRGRLQRHECTGTELPLDAYGKAFTRQVFVSDAMDNLVQVRTFWGQENNLAAFTYSETDPVQLVRITNSHADYPAEIVLDYDADGNLVQDEQGRGLAYDALGRLTRVDAPGGGADTTYQFDALDVLAGSTSAGTIEQRFYVEDTLAARVQGAQRSLYLQAGGLALAEKMTGDDAGTLLLGTDRSNTVLQEVRPGAEQHVAYTAYGFPSRGPLWTELGFNGELHETGAGWQLLGSGYRAYNTVLKRFHSPDDLSPFDEGGVNAYAYCGNDPVNRMDPDGHMWWAVALVAGGGLIAGSFAVKDDTLKNAMLVVGAGLMIGGLGGASRRLFGNPSQRGAGIARDAKRRLPAAGDMARPGMQRRGGINLGRPEGKGGTPTSVNKGSTSSASTHSTDAPPTPGWVAATENPMYGSWARQNPTVSSAEHIYASLKGSAAGSSRATTSAVPFLPARSVRNRAPLRGSALLNGPAPEGGARVAQVTPSPVSRSNQNIRS